VLQRIVIVTGLLSVITAGFAAPASAQTATLYLSDPVTSTQVVILDQSALDSNPTLGVIEYDGAVGPNWALNVTSGATKPDSGTATDPYMDVTSVDASSPGGGTLIIEFSDVDYGPLPSGSVFREAYGGTTVGTVSYSTFLDATDIVFGHGTLLASQGPRGPGAFNGTSFSSPVGAAFPYSLTQRLVITHQRAGWTGFVPS
jgi:hypothetical protein